MSEKRKNFLSQFKGCQTISMNDFLKIWRNYDTDKSGFIDIKPRKKGEESEFEKLVCDLMEVMYRQTMSKDDTKCMCQAFLLEHNTANKGKLGMNELIDIIPVEESGLQKLVVECKMSSLDVDMIFEHYDADHSGYIQEEELEQLVKDLVIRNKVGVNSGQLKEESDSEEEPKASEPLYSEVIKHKSELLALADTNNDGQIVKSELMLLLKLLLK